MSRREGGGMIWTAEKPTKPGWYWYRTSEEDKTIYMAMVRSSVAI